eukprot:gene24532-45307_t
MFRGYGAIDEPSRHAHSTSSSSASPMKKRPAIATPAIDRSRPQKKSRPNGSVATQRQSSTKALCKGCGNMHNLDKACWMRHHPDFNKSNKPWAESSEGINLNSVGHGKIIFNQRYNQNTRKMVPYPEGQALMRQ